MVTLIGDTALCGVLVRELLARKVDVSSAPLDAQRRADPDRVVVVAEGARDVQAALDDAMRSVELWGGSVLLATARGLDDPALVALRRRGVPYTIVRASGLVDLPSTTATSFVLVPSDLSCVPFATIDDLAAEVAQVVAAGRTGTGAVVDVTSHAGASDWAAALREAGARAIVVSRWVAALAGFFGVPRLDVVGRDVRFVTSRRASTGRALPALTA